MAFVASGIRFQLVELDAIADKQGPILRVTGECGNHVDGTKRVGDDPDCYASLDKIPPVLYRLLSRDQISHFDQEIAKMNEQGAPPSVIEAE